MYNIRPYANDLSQPIRQSKIKGERLKNLVHPTYFGAAGVFRT